MTEEITLKFDDPSRLGITFEIKAGERPADSAAGRFVELVRESAVLPAFGGSAPESRSSRNEREARVARVGLGGEGPSGFSCRGRSCDVAVTNMGPITSVDNARRRTPLTWNQPMAEKLICVTCGLRVQVFIDFDGAAISSCACGVRPIPRRPPTAREQGRPALQRKLPPPTGK